MIAIQKSKPQGEFCHPNLLPCRINHSGAVDASQRYWKPQIDQDAMKTSYFRGRKLHGRTVKLPPNYQGSILRTTDTNAASTVSDGARRKISDIEEDDEMEDDEEQAEERFAEERLAEELARFEEFTVWDHEALPPAEDPYVMGVEEWIGLAEAIHASSPASDEGQKRSQ